MMYVKLITQNLRKSIQAYSIYMVTLVVAVMLMYAYNGVALSNEIKELANRADALAGAAVFVTIGVVIVMGWLVYYISNFILQKRSQEFGMYLLLGMRRQQVTRMFILEQLCLGILAFFIGCFLGTFVFQIIQAIIMNTYSKDYVFRIQFSMKAFGLTFLCFLLIYAIELLRERRFLRKKKIYELLYSDKQNEKVSNKKGITSLYFIVAVVCLMAGLSLFDEFLNGLANNTEDGIEGFLPSIGLLIFSVYGFFFGISTLLSFLVHKQKRMKYHGNTMYLFSQIAGRLRSNRTVLGTLTILTILTLLFVALGLKFNEVAEVSNYLYAPFDIHATTTEPMDKTSITSYLDEQDIGYRSHEYADYMLENDPSTMMEALKGLGGYYPDEKTTYMKYSDYSALRELKGFKHIPLRNSEYIILTNFLNEEVFTSYTKTHSLAAFSLKTVDTKEIGQTASYNSFVLVVPDAFLEHAIVVNYNYAVESEQPSVNAWRTGIEKKFYEDNTNADEASYVGAESYVKIRSVWVEENLFSALIINFCLIYLAIIFVCISATILATQQLSDVMKQNRSYELLWKMGISKKEIYQLMRKQIAVYFFIPVILAMLYIFPLLYSLNRLFTPVIGDSSMYQYFMIALILFLLIYFCYYLLAYFGCKRSIRNI